MILFGFIVGLVGVMKATDGAGPSVSQPAKPYNVLVVIIDDVAANLNSAEDPSSPVRTPNIERLAAKGTWFSHAYNDAPVCSASRTAMLTGVHSARSGVYYNTQAYRRSGTWIADVQTLPASFKKAGFLTAGYGKVTHNRFAADDITDYTPGYYKMFDRKTDVTHTDPELVEQAVPGSVREIPGNSSKNWTWGTLPDDWDRDNPAKMQQDTEQANRTIGFLGAQHDRPFFLACGFWRPHVRWSVPQRYYDMFPLKDIQLPRGYRADDLEDLPIPGRWIAMHRREHADVLSGAMWREALRGYLASVAYVDEQIGRVLDALERSAYRDNTIVVFLSDNGMHLGEKDHWLKFALWEQTCRVFLSISVPGMPRQRIESPVGLIDLYPTLLNLCGVTPPGHSLDGVDLSKILRGESTARGKPVLSTYGAGNHTIRGDRYRYIRYGNGDEELYDHANDPYEWTNIADRPSLKGLKRDLAHWLPETDAPGVAEEEIGDNTRWSDESYK